MAKVYAQNEGGVKVDSGCITNGTCGFNLYQSLGIREDTNSEDNTFEVFTQDIFLSATFFIGTVVTFALVTSGLLIIFWWADEWQVQKWKDGVKRALVWLVLVIFSFTLIRVVQFVAQGQT